MTRSLSAELLGVQTPQILHLPPDVHSHAAAEEALDLADAAGMTLDESQRFTLTAALGERVDGTWAAFEVCDVEPRQNGKGDKIEARELAGLFLFGEHLIIHTAHEFPTANEAFLRMVARIDGCPDLSRQVKSIRYANGEQGIELMSGQRLKYRARTGGAGRGFAGAALVVLDEAYALKSEQLAALLPTMSTHPNPQLWLASSAGLSHSSALHRLRRRALAGDGGRLAYCEHTAENVRLTEDGKVESLPIDVTDRRLWALANPALGTRISVEYVQGELDAMGPERFARERLGVWDPEPVEGAELEPKLPGRDWESTRSVVRPEVTPGRVVLGFDVSPDGRDAAIGIAAGSVLAPWVGLVSFEPGSGWLADRLAELVEQWRPRHVLYNASGAVMACLPQIIDALRDHGCRVDVLHPLGLKDWKAACGGFYNDVAQHRLTRPYDQEPLDAAGAKAEERPLGDGWAWNGKRAGEVSISPLQAVTAARAGLPLDRPSSDGDFLAL